MESLVEMVWKRGSLVEGCKHGKFNRNGVEEGQFRERV